MVNVNMKFKLNQFSIVLILICTLSGYMHCAEYQIAWLAPAEADSDGIAASSSVGGLVLALNTIQEQHLLHGDNFTVKWQNTSCDSKGGITSIYQVLVVDTFAPDIVIGPPCTEAMTHIGELAGYRDLPIFTWMSDSTTFGDKNIYNSLVRSYGPANEIANSVLQFLEYMSWTTVELISSTYYYSMGKGIYDALIASSNNYKLARWQEAADVETPDNMKRYYANLKNEARIVLLAISLSELRAWMLAAFDSNMVNGEYVFIFLYNEIPSLVFKISVLETPFYNYFDGRDPDALIAYESMFVLTQNVEYVDSYPSFDTNAATLATQSKLTELGITGLSASGSDGAAPFLHDAVLLWAHLVNQSKEIGLNKENLNGTYILDRSKNQSFSDSYWATGHVQIDEKGDRKPNFWILDLGENKIFRVAMETKQSVSPLGYLTSYYEDVVPIIWGDGTVGFSNRPPSVPLCGFQNEHCPNLVPYVAPPSVIAGLAIVAIIIILIVRKYQFEQGLKDMSWKISKDDLEIQTENRYSRSFIRLSKARNVGNQTSKLSVADGESMISNQIQHNQAFIQTAKYKHNTVAVKSFTKHKLRMERDLLLEMRQMAGLKHTNLAEFVGATTETPLLFEAWQYCAKGSINDILFNDGINLDNMFSFSIATDIFKGLKYLHKSSLKFHGNLKSSNCVVDSRWVCKLTDFGLRHFHSHKEADKEISDHKKYSCLFWTSPEIIEVMSKSSAKHEVGSQQCDIYGGAIILKEIFSRSGPYTEHQDHMSPQEIIAKVMDTRNNTTSKSFRPDIKYVKTAATAQADLVELIKAGWCENPDYRPSASVMLSTLHKINPSKSSNVMDNMIKMLEAYSNNLEGLVEERTSQVEEEKKKSELLLYRLLPQSVAESLKRGEHVAPEAYDAVSVYFSDVVNFTSLAAQSTPMQVITLLNKLYTEFDAVVNSHDVYKVETIGDAYMYVSGLPQRNGKRHAEEVTSCAMELLSCVLNFKVPHLDDYTLRIRVGIHTGPVVAGVVGLTMPRFCLFGETVTVASLMESGGCPMRIQLSENTFSYLSMVPGYHFAERGVMLVKGKKMTTYFVVSKDNYTKDFPNFGELSKEDCPGCKMLPVT